MSREGSSSGLLEAPETVFALRISRFARCIQEEQQEGDEEKREKEEAKGEQRFDNTAVPRSFEAASASALAECRKKGAVVTLFGPIVSSHATAADF